MTLWVEFWEVKFCTILALKLNMLRPFTVHSLWLPQFTLFLKCELWQFTLKIALKMTVHTVHTFFYKEKPFLFLKQKLWTVAPSTFGRRLHESAFTEAFFRCVNCECELSQFTLFAVWTVSVNCHSSHFSKYFIAIYRSASFRLCTAVNLDDVPKRQLQMSVKGRGTTFFSLVICKKNKLNVSH